MSTPDQKYHKDLNYDSGQKRIPTLSQDAAKVESSTSTGKSVTSLNSKTLADLMLPPKEVDAVLAFTRSEDRETSKDSAKPATQTTTFKKPRDGGRKHSRHSLVETEFRLEAPLAGSVKLAADFTNWEKSPIDMTKSQDGIWRAVILLPHGRSFLSVHR